MSKGKPLLITVLAQEISASHRDASIQTGQSQRSAHGTVP